MSVHSPAAPVSHGPRVGIWVWRLLLGLALLGYLWHCFHLNFVADDAFISFRYARNLARGDGLVFNPGERVEGYTNFLLVVLLAPLYRFGIDLVAAGRALSILAGAASVIATALLARSSLDHRPLVAVAAAGLVAANPYVAAWAGSGLETTLFTWLLTGMALLANGPVDRRRFVAVSAVGLLLSLTRPEGVALYGSVALTLLITRPASWRDRWRTIAPGLIGFGVLGGCYFLCRWSYFGDLLPNTYYAKSAFTPQHIARGLEYLAGFAHNPFVWAGIPLLALGIVDAIRRRRLVLPVLLLTGLLIVVLEGGDGLPMYRFLVPLLPLSAVLVVSGTFLLTAAVARQRGEGLGLAIAVLLIVLSLFPVRDAQYRLFVFQRDWEVPRWSAAGRALAQALDDDALVAAVPIGALGWYSDLPILDMLGLTDRTIARTAATTGTGWAGHEKHDGRYVIARRPDAILLGNIFVTDTPEVPWESWPMFHLPAIRAREGDVLEQPEFEREYQPAGLPLENGWTLHLVVRRDTLQELLGR